MTYFKMPQSPAILYSYLMFTLSFLIFPISLFLMFKNQSIFIQWEMFYIFSSPIFFPILFDPYGMLFSSVVLFISANVLKFAETYMSGDPFLNRFIALIVLFILSMNMLIYFPHMMTLLLGWDGLGLVSFILVIYYSNPKSLSAGMITALTNRIGDAFILISIGWSLNNSHWIITNMWQSNMSNFIILSILIAAMTKSAQMPFSSWLPAAMAAPTPVSALVHSSTLVTAGVFLLIRFYPFLSSLKLFNTLLLITASMTMLMAGLSALTESDFKKIIALSTLSQLGVMMASLAMGFPTLTLFHLLTHAMFKALLFVCAGSMIHFHLHDQDLRKINNMSIQTPLTMACFLIANLSLCGSPFLAGFYSKDFILEISLFSPMNSMALLMFYIATGVTAAYTVRFLMYSMWSAPSSPPIHNIFDKDPNIFVPALLLTMGAIFSGSSINWWLAPIDQESFLPLQYKLLPLLVTIIGALLSMLFFSSFSPTLINMNLSHNASCSMWFLVPLSSQAPMSSFLPLAHNFQKLLDHGWVEMMGGQGIFTLFSKYYLNPLKVQKSSPNIFIHLSSLMLIPLMFFFL
uniref:NADH-ubiquinone oxidoreductase chain 5 n=1 Tax=Terebellides stroemii TaxID=1037239 RepID=B3TJX3_9ANNE|nr:NADH dehydrogenase subunit 5 [Terebellides stroemii]ABW76479.1 NADH dehydrogenase subunit 5 [Terebellides stroemii]